MEKVEGAPLDSDVSPRDNGTEGREKFEGKFSDCAVSRRLSGTLGMEKVSGEFSERLVGVKSACVNIFRF